MRRDSGIVRSHYGSTGRVTDRARNGSLTARQRHQVNFTRRGDDPGLNVVPGFAATSPQTIPATYRSKASAEVVSGIGIRGE